MALAIGLLTADMLLHAVLRSGLLRASYVDERGQQQPAGPLFIVQVPTSFASEPNWVHGAKDHDPSPCFSQHLFLTFPRIVFMLGFVVFVFFLLAGYTMFHCFLALVNQTSNEWFKSRGLACRRCRPAPQADSLCGPAPDRSERHCYSRGLLGNLREIFFPPNAGQKKGN